MRIIWTTPARESLRNITVELREKNPSAAIKMASRVRSRVKQLSVYPALGRPGTCAGTRELVITGVPYVVAYAVRDTAVVILHVQHTAQLWPESIPRSRE